ncbi:hypothetical protein NXV85_23380, partial [Bacteroides fragilis]|nr:hypothetical protein [Bacteroides fragilis]
MQWQKFIHKLSQIRLMLLTQGYLAKDQTRDILMNGQQKPCLHRVYLTKGDNENALKVAEDIITNSPYKLWTNEEYVNA